MQAGSTVAIFGLGALGLAVSLEFRVLVFKNNLKKNKPIHMKEIKNFKLI